MRMSNRFFCITLWLAMGMGWLSAVAVGIVRAPIGNRSAALCRPRTLRSRPFRQQL